MSNDLPYRRCVALAALLEMTRSASGLWPARAHTTAFRLIDRMADNSTMRSLIEELKESDAALQVLSRRSYEHINGFLKVVLVPEQANGYRLTLHVWRNRSAAAIEAEARLHSHRFDFISALLTGTLVTESFVASQMQSGRSWRGYRYQPGKDGEISTYERLGQVSLQRIGAFRICSGDCYAVEHSSIHRVILPRAAALTATLVLRAPQRRAHAEVYVRARTCEPGAYAVRPIQPSRLKTILAKLSREMVSDGPHRATHPPASGVNEDDKR